MEPPLPISWRIFEGIVYLESDEATTFEEWRDAVGAAISDPAFRPGMGIIHDWRKHATALSSAEVTRRSAYLAQNAARFGRTRWALLVDNSAGYGMGRMKETLTGSGTELRVFRDSVDAEAWARGQGGDG